MLPLDHLRVLDFTHMAPGQFCTMMLADMGADVLRVEQPQRDVRAGRGDATSSKWERLMTGGYRVFNRGKSSIMVNLRSDEGRQIVCRIAEGVDVVVEGFRPGVVSRLGIDYRALADVNPGVIYCSMSGYGQEGPYRDMPGHDINYVAMGGALGTFGDPPPVIPNIIADYAGAALHAVIGILLALTAREKTGKGQYVDIGYTDGVVSLMSQFISPCLAMDEVSREISTNIMFSNAGYGVYMTKDGKYISLGCAEPWFWQSFCQAIGRDDLIGQFAIWEKQKEIREIFAEVFLTKARDEWFEHLRVRNIPVGKVYLSDEMFRDPQLLLRHMLVEVDDAKGAKEKHVGIPIKLSETPGMIRSTAPIPGQHTKQTLLDLGYSEEEVEALCKKGVVALPSVDQ